MWARVLHIWSNIRYVLCVKPVATNGSVIDRIAPLSLPISPCPMGPKNHVILQTILTPCFSLFSLLLSLHFISTNPTATRESTGNILISSCHFHHTYYVLRLTDRNFLASLVYSANHPSYRSFQTPLSCCDRFLPNITRVNLIMVPFYQTTTTGFYVSELLLCKN